MGCVTRMMDVNRPVLLAIALWAGTVAAAEGPAYPLKIGPTGRYLVDQRGEPVFVNGDSPWSLAAQLSREDVELYLRNRAALGEGHGRDTVSGGGESLQQAEVSDRRAGARRRCMSCVAIRRAATAATTTKR
jgi:hypothetical protein